MKIYDLLDMEMLVHALIPGGYVRAQTHPVWPDLVILNYTEKCAFERAWNKITSTCRGLIYNVTTGEVLARPFPKFFNYGEPGAPEIPLDTRVEVTDKLDGSLGILYPTPDGEWAVATRGSFDSEQARHATAVWQRRYADQCGRLGMPFAGVTLLFEIIYPANRIVVDYSDLDDLVLLGAVDIEYGCSFSPYETEAFGEWPGPRAVSFGHPTLADALAMKPRPGAEGVVVRRWHSEDRIKLKQDEYVTLHRLITGCTARRLWESLAVNACAELGDTKFLTRRLFLAPDRINGILEIGPGWLEPFVTQVPEEFRDWVIQRVTEMERAVYARLQQLLDTFNILRAMLGDGGHSSASREDSKRFAEIARATAPQDFNLMMSLWRGHEIASTLWREIRPEHELPYRAVDESVA
jgi:RNA ligase